MLPADYALVIPVIHFGSALTVCAVWERARSLMGWLSA